MPFVNGATYSKDNILIIYLFDEIIDPYYNGDILAFVTDLKCVLSENRTLKTNKEEEDNKMNKVMICIKVEALSCEPAEDLANGMHEFRDDEIILHANQLMLENYVGIYNIDLTVEDIEEE